MVLPSREIGVRRASHFYNGNDGYYYHKYKEVRQVCYFRCILRSCTARGVMRLDFELRTNHNHEPNLQYANFRRERRMIMDEAASMIHYPMRDTINFIRSNIGEFAGILTYDYLRPALRRARLAPYPKEPGTLRLLIDILENPLYASLCAVTDMDSLYEGFIESQDGFVALLLMTKRCAEVLRWAPWLYAFTLPVRGTHNHFQIHIIGTVLGKTSVPLACLLLESGALEAHVAGLSILRARLVHWNFRKLVARDDGVEAEAYQQVFGVAVEFPYDQFLQDIGKLWKSLIQEENFWNHPDVVEILDLCCGLPMIPQNMLMLSFAVIKQKIDVLDHQLLKHCLCVLLFNIEIYWINSPLRSYKFFICGSSERTNSSFETTQERFKRSLGRDGIGLYAILGHLKRIESVSMKDVADINCGREPRTTRATNSLSEDTQIVVLTRALVRLRPNLPSDLINLMMVASSKRKHIFMRALLQV